MASLAGVLCGFSFTALALLLALQDERRSVELAVRSTIAAAATLLVSTILFSYLSFVWAGLPRRTGAGVVFVSTLATVSFFIGMASLLCAMGVSGFIRSRKTGVFSAGLAIATAVATVAGIIVLGTALG